jgi:hypothetical protein
VISPPLRLLLVLSCVPLTLTAAPGVSTAGYITETWNDNLSHSSKTAEERAAAVISASGSFSQRFSLTRDTALISGGAVGVETCPRYDGLDTLSATAHLEIRQKFGLGALAPVLSLKAEAGAATFRESARNGWSATSTLGLAKRFNDAFRVVVNAEWSHQEARQTVFDRENRGLSAELNWDVTDHWQLGFGACRQWGQQEANASLSTWSFADSGGAGPALANYYEHIPYATSNTFGPGWVAYRIDGYANLWWLSLCPALGPNTSLPLRYETAEIHGGAGTRYLSHQLSLSLVHRY